MVKKQVEVSIEKYLETLKAKNIRVQRVILYGSDFGQNRFKEAVMLKSEE